MNQPDSLTEKRKSKTRYLIADRANALFAARGFENVTVEEIAVATEVSRRTVFRYFPTKELMVFPFQEQRLALFRKLLAGHQATQTPFVALRLTLLDFARHYTENRRELLAQHCIVKASPLLIAREFEFDLEYEAAIAEALLGGGLDPLEARVIAGALFGAIHATLRAWFAGRCRGDLAGMGGKTLDLLAAGLSDLPKRR